MADGLRGTAFPGSGGGGRGHLQPSHRTSVRARAGAHRREAFGGKASGEVEPGHGELSGHSSPGRRPGGAPGRALVWGNVRLLSFLHAWEPVRRPAHGRCPEGHPGLWDKVASGDMRPLLSWLREEVHARGRIYPPEELIRKVTGEGLSPKPFLDYVKVKYEEVYRL